MSAAQTPKSAAGEIERGPEALGERGGGGTAELFSTYSTCGGSRSCRGMRIRGGGHRGLGRRVSRAIVRSGEREGGGEKQSKVGISWAGGEDGQDSTKVVVVSGRRPMFLQLAE